MRKYLLVTLVDGAQFERDIPQFHSAPLGAPANDRFYLMLAMQISSEGFCEDPTMPRPRWIAPAQIKHVEVVFE